jgi:hypothetical protein
MVLSPYRTTPGDPRRRRLQNHSPDPKHPTTSSKHRPPLMFQLPGSKASTVPFEEIRDDQQLRTRDLKWKPGNGMPAVHRDCVDPIMP